MNLNAAGIWYFTALTLIFTLVWLVILHKTPAK